MFDFSNKNILVLGLKKSGKGAIRLLKTIKTNIFISDINITQQISGTTTLPYNDLKNHLSYIDIIVKSPGIPDDCDILKLARSKNIIIISEIELAYHFVDKNKVIVGVTGTNGKTTTSSIITNILKLSNIPAVCCGNIGATFSDSILDNKNCDVYVVELSSFQLNDIIFFKPHICVMLNLKKAHLDYHKSFKNYIKAKLNLFKNIDEDSILIYNMDDKLVKKKIKKYNCQKYAFSLFNKTDVYLNQEKIRYNGYTIINTDEIKLKGMHNLSNVLAATLIAKVFYIENEIIYKALKTFSGLAHRLQFVDKIDDVSFYNDSKATNTQSTISALNSFNQSVILILGGYDRRQKFNKIIKHKNVKFIIGYGETKDRIYQTAIKYKKACVIRNNLLNAFVVAKSIAFKGDIVLFSPASASFDEFNNYEERGNYFINLVKNLKNKNK